jgi:hypothetical protein
MLFVVDHDVGESRWKEGLVLNYYAGLWSRYWQSIFKYITSGI